MFSPPAGATIWTPTGSPLAGAGTEMAGSPARFHGVVHSQLPTLRAVGNQPLPAQVPIGTAGLASVRDQGVEAVDPACCAGCERVGGRGLDLTGHALAAPGHLRRPLFEGVGGQAGRVLGDPGEPPGHELQAQVGRDGRPGADQLVAGVAQRGGGVFDGGPRRRGQPGAERGGRGEIGAPQRAVRKVRGGVRGCLSEHVQRGGSVADGPGQRAEHGKSVPVAVHTPASGTTPGPGLRPTTPQQAAGIRIDPPPSEPSASAAMPDARAAAPPPVDPPGVRPVSHGLRVAG